MDIFPLMDSAFARSAADIHLSVGRRPVFRLSGGLVEIGDHVLTARAIAAAAGFADADAVVTGDELATDFARVRNQLS